MIRAQNPPLFAWLLRAALAVAACALLANAIVANPPLVPADAGIVVLKNGETLCGRVTWEGDRYWVSAPGRQIAVRSSEVAMVCRDLDDAYRRQREELKTPSAEDHQQLAQWCLRQELLGNAAAELAEATRLDPFNRRTKHLASQLDSAIRRAQQKTAPTVPYEKVEREEKLTDLAATLPEGAVETFTAKIQPILLNRCAAARCHGGADAGKFRLATGDFRSPESRRLTEQNLLAALAQIDRIEPERSAILNASRNRHGNLSAAAFAPHEIDQYERLAQWVHQLLASDAEKNDRSLASPAPSGPSLPPRRADRQSAGNQADPAVDPFDPAVFNRRFFPNHR